MEQFTWNQDQNDHWPILQITRYTPQWECFVLW